MAFVIAKNTKDGIRRLHTKVISRDGLFEVQLYNTFVYSEEGNEIVLDNGGWVTPTTTSRMNQALRHRGIKGWAVIRKFEMFYQDENYKLFPFVDGKYTILKGLDLKCCGNAGTPHVHDGSEGA